MASFYLPKSFTWNQDAADQTAAQIDSEGLSGQNPKLIDWLLTALVAIGFGLLVWAAFTSPKLGIKGHQAQKRKKYMAWTGLVLNTGGTIATLIKNLKK